MVKCDKYFEKVKGKCKKTNFGKIQEIKDEHQSKKIGKFLVDAQTANVVLKVHSSLKPENRKKYHKIINSDVKTASQIAWKLTK